MRRELLRLHKLSSFSSSDLPRTRFRKSGSGARVLVEVIRVGHVTFAALLGPKRKKDKERDVPRLKVEVLLLFTTLSAQS
jgi:hypothetical protein